MWRLEPEFEAERPEATVPWNGVEGVSVNPEDEIRHRQVWAKIARKERKNQTKKEKVDGEAPGDEGAEIQSPQRRVIRVESEETLDYVRASLELDGTGPHAVKNWQWKADVEKTAHRGSLWRMLGKDQYIQGMWEYLSLERVKAKSF